jgi:hypothetical protein
MHLGHPESETWKEYIASFIMLNLHFEGFLFVFWWDWSLNSELHTYKAGALPLEPHLQFILL